MAEGQRMLGVDLEVVELFQVVILRETKNF